MCHIPERQKDRVQVGVGAGVNGGRAGGRDPLTSGYQDAYRRVYVQGSIVLGAHATSGGPTPRRYQVWSNK